LERKGLAVLFILGNGTPVKGTGQDRVEKAITTSLVVLICAAGRALDFATTWVAIERGQAVEAKPFAADIFHLLGQHVGMISYVAFITTQAIFLGSHLAVRAFRVRSADDAANISAANASRLLFFLTGVVSLAVALHNVPFLFSASGAVQN